MNIIETKRLTLGFTQEQLAEKLNVDRTTIGKWELGKATPRSKNLLALSELLSCSVEDILRVR